MVDTEARAEHELRLVSGEIHDWFFDLDDIQHDLGGRLVVIPFRRWDESEEVLVSAQTHSLIGRLAHALGRKTFKAPFYRWYLRIYEARAIDVRDEAEIGTADFSAVEFDAEAKEVIVRGNIPVTIRVRVDHLHVRVEQTRSGLGWTQYPRWLGGIGYSGTVRQ